MQNRTGRDQEWNRIESNRTEEAVVVVNLTNLSEDQLTARKLRTLRTVCVEGIEAEKNHR